MLLVVCDIKKMFIKDNTIFFKIVLSMLFLALLFFLITSKIMSKRKAPVITYKDIVQNILTFVENNDMEYELDPLFEN